MCDIAQAPVILGRAYDVPCIRFTGEGAGEWGVREWWPTLGPRHEDAALLRFQMEHYHLDPRFMTEKQYRYALRRVMATNMTPEEALYGSVLCVTNFTGAEYGYVKRVRRLTAMRYAAAFPKVRFRDTLRDAYESHTLKDGLVCPHKGAPLSPHADAEGIAICPLHGLCWNLRERRLATDAEEASHRERSQGVR